MYRIRKIVKWTSIVIASLFTVLVVSAFGYEHLSRLNSKLNYSPEGEMVMMEGHRLHYLLEGDKGPTVVFESGLDTRGHLSWYKVQPELNNFATTLSYDRAGILWSERGTAPKSLSEISQQLTSLLNAIDAPTPYIVVGHSAAGIYLRKFIKDNESSIAGIILVDASHPDQTLARPPKLPSPLMKLALGSLGLMRLTMPSEMPNTGPDDRINSVGNALIHRSYESLFEEGAGMLEMSEQAARIESFGDIPLVVISATAYKRSLDSMNEEARELLKNRERLQSDLLNLSSNSRQINAPNSNHYVQIDQPEIVISAIKEMIDVCCLK